MITTAIANVMRSEHLSGPQKLEELVRLFQWRRWRNASELTMRRGAEAVRLQLRPGSTDHKVVWQSFTVGQYEIPVMLGRPSPHKAALERRHRDVLAAGKTPLIVDCGANMGASAAWFHLRYPGSAIAAVEPSPGNCRMLRQNTAGLGDVRVFEAGIGSHDGQTFLHDDEQGEWALQTRDTPSGTAVPLLRLDTLLSQYSEEEYEPFVLKVDIEGAEQALFGDSWETLDAFPLIVVETHDYWMPGQGTSNNFFRFHAWAGREFLYAYENVFSIQKDLLRSSGMLPVETLPLSIAA